MGKLFRCVGDVSYTQPVDPQPPVSTIKLPEKSESWSFLQYLKPLTPRKPSFSVCVKCIDAKSRIIIGIASDEIEENTPPGHWNNTVGYHSDTGRCYSSHDASANTTGEPFGLGDKITVTVSYFNKKSSNVIFYKNGLPVATRYFFSSNHKGYFPCLYLVNGPVELEVNWSRHLSTQLGTVSLSDVSNWVVSPGVKCSDGIFSYDKVESEASIQSTATLGPSLPFFDLTVHECSNTGIGPTVAITSCSPIKPTPPCPLLRDYLKWEPNSPLAEGDHVGWGVHHSPDKRNRPDFDPRSEQIVHCFVLKNNVMQCFQMMLQPPGGFYPMALLNQKASKISVKNGECVPKDITLQLDKIYRDLLPDIKDLLETDAIKKRLTLPMLRLSEALNVDISPVDCHVGLHGNTQGIHTIQFLHPISKDSSYFFVEIDKLSGGSWVSVGVAGPSLSLSQPPGSVHNSVGIASHQGHLLHNNLTIGNMEGEKFGAGDKLGVQISYFADRMAVVLFMKNNRPIGTRYLTEPDRNRYLPTVALCAEGQEVAVNIVWQTRVETAPHFYPTNLEHWCLPQGSEVKNDVVMAIPHKEKFQVVQGPTCLQSGFNHYEIQLVDEFNEHTLPPVLALCSACPRDPSHSNKYNQDFIRFWPKGKAASTVSKGDLIGWGVLPSDSNPDSYIHGGNLVICYLTVNRTVVLTHVLVLPPGGFYPVVIIPPGLSKVKFEFSASHIVENPVSPDQVQILIGAAKKELQQLPSNKRVAPPVPYKVSPTPEKAPSSDRLKHHRSKSASNSVTREGLPDEYAVLHKRQASTEIETARTSKKREQLPAEFKSLHRRQLSTGSEKSTTSKKSSKGPEKADKKHKHKKSKKMASLGKSTEIKFQDTNLNYEDEDIGNQYQSRSCIIL